MEDDVQAIVNELSKSWRKHQSVGSQSMNTNLENQLSLIDVSMLWRRVRILACVRLQDHDAERESVSSTTTQPPTQPHNHTTTQPHNHNHIHNHTTTSAINQHRINIESDAIHNHDNVHVGLLAVLVVAQHFRTHVHWSSDACHRLRLLWLDRRDSKVGNLARPLAVYQQILWLQVSMNQFARVQVAPCRIVVS